MPGFYCEIFVCNWSYFMWTTDHSEATTGGVLQKKMFWKIWKILWENTCVGVFLLTRENIIKKYIKNRLQHRCFLVEFAKFLRTPIPKNICERLLLKRLLLSSRLPFLISYTSGSNWYLCFSFYIIICSFFASSPFTTTDSAIIKSSRPVVFWRKGVLTNFAKFTRKPHTLKTSF